MLFEEALIYAVLFKEMLIYWRPAKHQLEKGKRGFPFSYKSNAYAIDLAARPWAAMKALNKSALS